MLLETDVVKITNSGQTRINEVIHRTGRDLREPEADILMYLHLPGEATVEELGMNLKMPAKDLIPALEWLKGLQYIYVTPFKPHSSTFNTTATKQNLSKSMSEEAKASFDYKARGLTSDPKTNELYVHIAKEEDGHYDEFSKRLNELEK